MAGGSPLRVCAAPNVRRLSKQGREVCNTTRKSNIPYYKMWVQQDALRTKQAVRLFLVIFLVELLHNQVIDSIQFGFILDSAEGGLTVVFLNGLENANL